MPRETMTSLQSEIAHVRTRMFHHYNGHKKWYERNRQMENRIRNCALRNCSHTSPQACLNALAQGVPLNARKKWDWRNAANLHPGVSK